MSDSEPKIVMMKLDSEDYENIFLRVRGKLFWQLAGLAVLICGGSIATFFFTVREGIERGVDKYIQTESFRESIAKATIGKTDDLQKRLEKIDAEIIASEGRVATLAKLPVSIENNGLVLLDQNGQSFFIETGIVKDGGSIDFASRFKGVPTVLLNVTGNSLGRYDGVLNVDKKYRPSYPEVTGKGFRMPSTMESRSYTWVAIGK